MPDIKPLSSTTLSASAIADKKPSATVSSNNRPFNFLWNLRNELIGTDTGADSDVVKANEGNMDALKGEEIKMLPKDILLKALKEARIEQSDENIEIVKALVKENLPLSPKNISTLAAHSALFKDASLETLATMMRHNIPMTKENVEQFENLIKTGESLADKVNNLIEQLPAEIINNSKNLSELSLVFSKFSALLKSADVRNGKPSGQTDIASLNKLMEAVIKKSADLDSSGGYGRTREIQAQPVNLNKPLLSNAELRELIDALRAIKAPISLLSRVVNINAETMRNPQLTQQAMSGGKSPVQTAAEDIVSIIDRFVQEINTRTQAETVRRPLNSNENETANVRNRGQRFTVEDVGGRKELFENIKNLLLNKSFGKVIESSIAERLLLKPQNMNITEAETVLTKLNDNLEQFTQQFRETNLDNVRADVKDIQDAARLMNDLNKSISFLQIPLKLSEQIVNSELYVLTKIKKEGQGTGSNNNNNLNVLLKLELDNLGTLDIYINMNGKMIRSKFFSTKDDTLEIVKEYLPELNSSISTLGFSFRSSVTKTERGFDFVEDFLNRELPRTEFRRQALHLNI